MKQHADLWIVPEYFVEASNPTMLTPSKPCLVHEVKGEREMAAADLQKYLDLGAPGICNEDQAEVERDL